MWVPMCASKNNDLNDPDFRPPVITDTAIELKNEPRLESVR